MMKKLMLIIVGLCFLPGASHATETPPFLIQPLDDSAAFTVAKSIKLGRDASDSRLPGGKTPYSNTLPPKEKYECVKDADCKGVYVCRSNKCIDPCTGVTCPGGQKCSVGKCVSCSRGEACGCSSPNVSSGSGSCFDPCDPNKCASSTPTCTRSGANYSCACTSTSCGAGKKCSGSSCTNCAANESCNCPSGQKANGSGGCAAVACSSNSDCGAGKQCVNAGTTSAYCSHCTANSQCTCPSGQLANGSGSCVKPVCYDNTPCGAGRQCIDAGKYNAACDPCPSGTQCTCPSGQVADGSGGCGVAGCAGALASARPDVAVAENASQLTTALASGKDTIAVTESFTFGSNQGSNTAISLGSKKLVGPKYFAYVDGCKSAATPTLTVGATSPNGSIAMSGGEISSLNIKHSATSDTTSTFSTIAGSGTIADTSIALNLNAKSPAPLLVSGTMTLKGNVSMTGSVVNDTNYVTATAVKLKDASSKLNIEGKTTINLTTKASYGINIGAGSVTVASSGSLEVSTPGAYSVIDMRQGSFIANGPVKLLNADMHAVSLYGGTFHLKADGNQISSKYSGIYSSGYGGVVTIDGTLTHEFLNNGSDNSAKTALNPNAWEDKFTINKAITVKGDMRADSTRFDSILESCGGIEEEGGYVRINAPLKKSGSGKVGLYLCGRQNLRFQNKADVVVDMVKGYENSAKISAVSGAKLTVGSTCRKATGSGTYTFPKGDGSSYGWQVPLTSPPSIFSSGC